MHWPAGCWSFGWVLPNTVIFYCYQLMSVLKTALSNLKTLPLKTQTHKLPRGACVIYASIWQPNPTALHLRALPLHRAIYFSRCCNSVRTFGTLCICVCFSTVKNLDVSGSWQLPRSELCSWRHCSYFSQDVRVRSANTSFVSGFLPHVKPEMLKVAASLVFIYLSVMHMKLSLHTQGAVIPGGLMSDLLPSFTSV